MKKIFINILLIIFVLQSTLLPAYASDAKSTSLQKDIQFLQNLDIVGNWNVDDFISRAEFVNAVVRCIIKNSGAKDMSVPVLSNEDVFEDVLKDYWASYNIAVAKKQGIICGTDENMFNPEEFLSNPAAIKIAVEALGYAPVAHAYGGFPTGYFAAAAKIGIVCNAENENMLTKGEAASVLRGMLESIPMKNIYTDKEIKSEFPDNDDDTLLNITFSIRNFEGIVVSNEYSSYDSVVSQSEGMVKIRSLSNGNTAVFEQGETKASDYLGRHINVYYHDAKPYKLFYVEPINNANSVSIQGNDIVDFSFEDKEIKFEITENINRWEENTTKKKVKVPVKINIIRNGIFSSDLKAIFDVMDGNTSENIHKIDFYDNDSDGVYDLINVITYYTIRADYVLDNTQNLVVSDSYTNKSINIDKTDKDIKVKRYTQDGFETSNFGIVEGATVSVAYAKGDVEIYNIYINKESTVDAIEAIGENELLSKNHIYKVSNTITKYLNDSSLSLNDAVDLGDEYTIYLDHNNNIAGFMHIDAGYDTYYKMVKNKDDFIYIIDIYENPERPSELIADVVTLEGEVKNFIVSQQFEIDDKKVAMRGKMGLSKAEAISMIKEKLVMYKLDEDGKIKSVTLPKVDSDDNVFSYCEGVNQTDGPVYLKHRAGPHVFFDNNLGSAIINANTTILWVPHKNLVDKGVDYSLYCKRGTTSDFKSDQKYYVNAYKVNASSVVADILIAHDDGSSKITSFSRPIIVSKVVNAINNSGNFSQKLYGMQDAKQVEICSSQSTFKDKSGANLEISAGDIVRCDLDAKGDCIIADIKFDYDNYEDDTGGFSQAYRVARGSVYYKDATAFYFVVNKWNIIDTDIIPKNLECQLCTSSVKFIEVDVENETIKSVTAANLVGYKFDQKNYSQVVVANSYGAADLVVIYK